jgi:hypothetical protein
VIRTVAVASAIAVFMSGSLTTAVAASGDNAMPLATAPGQLVTVHAGHTTDSYAPILAPRAALRSTASQYTVAQTSTIQVNYVGFSLAAQQAFQAAVDVWETIVVSSQVIHVNASWTNLGSASGILGQAGAHNVYLESDNVWYPSALEESRCSCNADTGTEISAEFNSAFPYWYLGTDGNVPGSKWDLETVVLHELGHGLGFFSTFQVQSGTGSFGILGHATRFDLNQWDAASGGSKLVSYPSGSSALKTHLTNNSVYMGGSHLTALLAGRAKLFAPATWQGGSSNSHLDDAKYAPGTINALMTPVLNNGEAVHHPGPITVAIFQDIGWSVAGNATAPGAPRNVTATAADAAAVVAWDAPTSNGGSAVTGYVATSTPGGRTCSTSGSTGCTVNGLNNGTQYTFKVTATNSAGTGPASASSNPVVPHVASADVVGPVAAAPVVSIVMPQVVASTVNVRVAWSAATDDSGIAAYELQRRTDAGVWVGVALGTPTSTSVNVTVARGSNTSFRVRATDGVGNIGAWASVGPALLATVQQAPSGSMAYSGTWASASLSGSLGGTVMQSSTTNAAVTFTFTGRNVAFVTTRAPGRGIAAITIDGSSTQLVDLYRSTSRTKSVVWVSSAALGAGTHTVVVRVTGTKNASSSSKRIDIDAFLVWR